MIWDTVKHLVQIGMEVVDSDAIPWLTTLVEDLEDRKDDVLDLVRPFFAAANAALAGEDLLGAAIRLAGGEDPPAAIIERIYEIRRPFMAQATSVLQAAGFEPRS
jgi:hypothetical protein